MTDLSAIDTPDDLIAAMRSHKYLADTGLATSIFLAMKLGRPLLLEGEAGVGKTEVAKVLSAITGGELIRLQCYEGIDASQALYEWDYAKQLLHLRTAEAAGAIDDVETFEGTLYSERFLVKRPLLQALTTHGAPPVLLVDEVDRADDEFEAFLLEVLSDYSVTVPEIGTFTAEVAPIVIVTSNRTRDVHDALKRRCLYHWVEHPNFTRELSIIQARMPQISQSLARQVAAATTELRGMGMYKPPGIAETLNWSEALVLLGKETLDAEAFDATMGTLLKYREDQQRVRDRGLADVLTASVL